jgi:hypothetical protein
MFCQKKLADEDMQDHSIGKTGIEKIMADPGGETKINIDGIMFTDKDNPETLVAVCIECINRSVSGDCGNTYELVGFTRSVISGESPMHG